ncbi:hypothetical protein M407DRAFT_236221 [Tulasnella calospora MUT 4182]|uniref:Uncharacterized protein n=1 Tax=Tulasnella calospora MUT 4182 TaxID=1051891 RepID=A0A0C3LX40_9AGAM|nr:hypothetical protein M407DRAFT_236221 [Tulasnella calospora MUT 4182]
MSQLPSKDPVVPMDALRQAPSRFVITSKKGVSREKFLQHLNLPKGLETMIGIQSRMEELSRTRFVVSCPDHWVWNQVLQHISVLDQDYDVNLDTTSSSSSPGSVVGGWGDGAATPSLESTSGPSTFGTPSNGSNFSSPWAILNPLESPVQEFGQSPSINHGRNSTSKSVPVPLGPSTASHDSACRDSTGLDKNEANSDKDEDFFAVAEEEEYVKKWDGRNGYVDEKRENDETFPSEGQAIVPAYSFFELTTVNVSIASREGSGEFDNNSFGYQGTRVPAHNRLGLEYNEDPEGNQGSSVSHSNEEQGSLTSDRGISSAGSDLEMTEEDEAEGDAEEGIVNGYETDHSKFDSAHSLHHFQQQAPSQQIPVASSDPNSISVTSPTTTNPRIAEANPTANQGTSPGTSYVFGSLLDSEESERLGDVTEAPALENLVNSLAGLALVLPDGVFEFNPSFQSGSANTPVEDTQESPDTSAESEVLLEMMQQSISRTLVARALVSAIHQAVGFMESEQE